MSTRQQARQNFAAEVRIALLETDADEKDDEMRSLRDDVKAIKAVLIGLLISITTASILLLLNITTGTVHH